MKVCKLISLTIYLSMLFTSQAFPQVPNILSNGSVADAGDLNENFDSLSGRIDGNTDGLFAIANALDSAFRFSQVYFSSVNFSTSFGAGYSEVLAVTCPVGSLMVGGGVECSADGTNRDTTNAGVVNSTIPVGNSIIGSCAADALIVSGAKFGPGLTVRAICLSSAIIPPQQQALTSAAERLNDSAASIKQTPGQGAASEETLLAIERMKRELSIRAAEM